MEEHDLNRQLNRLIEGTIKAGDFTRLQDALRSDPEARQTYYDLLGVDLLLSEQFETRDYITVHSQAMDDSWAVRRARRGMVAWSLAGAAAILLLTLSTFFFLRASRMQDITISASDDSSFSVNGGREQQGFLKAGDSLDLAHGVVSLALGPYVEACVEGPARVRLLDQEGRFEIQQGSAYFQISPGGRDFEVHTPAGVIHDIGTKFGVRVLPGGTVETHVTAGAVDIERPDGSPRHRVEAGNAVRWSTTDSFNTARINADLFVQNLPWQTVVLKEDFSDEDGTSLSGKDPALGQPWMVLNESNPTLINRGLLDTSFGPRNLSVGFRTDASSGRRRVYLMTFATAVPENIDDKEGFADASEGLTLWDMNGRSLVSIIARASGGHRWQLKDEASGTLSPEIPVSALEAKMLTVCYEHETGMTRIYQGSNPRGKLLAELQTRPHATPRSLTVSNIGGGDLAIDHLEARVVTYPQASKSGN